MGITKNIATRWPNISGLIAGTTTQVGRIPSLIPVDKLVAGGSANISDAPNNVLLLESNDFILFEDGEFIGVE